MSYQLSFYYQLYAMGYQLFFPYSLHEERLVSVPYKGGWLLSFPYQL